MKTLTLRVLASMVCLVLVGAVARGAESGTPVEGPLLGPALARDGAGHLYLAGHADDKTVFLHQLDPSGGTVLRTTTLEGFDPAAPLALAVMSTGEAVLVGSGGGDAVVVRVAADGISIVSRSTFGGKALDAALAVALDVEGNAWIAGRTASDDLSAEGVLTGLADAFVVEIDPSGSVRFARYLGGSEVDEARGIALDKEGAIYVTGNFGLDAFLAKLAPKSATLVFTSPFGDPRDDAGIAVAVSPSGDVLVAGTTRSAEGVDSAAFLAAFDPASGVHLSSTSVDGVEGDGALALAVDRTGAAWLAGLRGKDAVAWRIEPDAAGSIRTELLAGDSDDLASGVVVDGNGDAWVAGLTRSEELAAATRRERALGGDAFLARLPNDDLSPKGVCPGTKNFTGATSLAWETGTNWSGGTVPVATDDVCISGFNVTVASGSQVAATLRVENGSLTISNGTLTVDGASEINGPLTVSAGTLTGAGNLTVSGPFAWSGGTLSGAGAFTTNGASSVTGTSAKLLQRTWNVNANVTWTGIGNVSIATGVAINNAATWDSQVTSASITGGTFNNSGTFKKTAGAGATSLTTAFANTGSLLVQFATLDFPVASSSTGNLDVASGATLRFSGGAFQVNAGTTFTGAGTVSSIGGTLLINAAITIPATLTVEQNGGTISGAGTLTIAGTLNWLGGTMNGAGVTTCNGPTNLSGTGVKLVSERTLNLNNGAVWTGTGTFSGQNAAVVNSPGTFDCQSDASLGSGAGAQPIFNNSGTFKKSAGAGTTPVQFQFNNSGSALVQSGKLNLRGGGTMTGTFNVSAGSTLEFGAAQELFNAGTTFAGTGNVLLSGGNFRVSSPVTIPAGLTFDMTGGNVLGTTLTLGGTFNWSGGSQLELGTTTCNGALNVSGSAALAVGQRILNANGATTYTGTGTLTLSNGAVINNNGTWDFQSDVTIAQGGALLSSFKNFATLRKSSGAGTLTVPGIFTNSGTLEVQAGTLGAAGYTQTSGTTTLTGGAFSSAANIAIQGGTLAGTGTVSGPVTVSGTGALAPGLSAGTLNLGGSYTQQAPNGAFNVELGGLAPGTQYDRATVTGAGVLAGVLNVSLINGFVPAPGDSFTIMTYASRTGSYTANLPAVPCVSWQVDYNATTLVLTAVAAPPPVEIAALTSTSKTTLGWAAGSAAGIVYDVMRGDLSTLPVGPGAGETCLANGLASTSTTDLTIPAAGTGFWYVVRGRVPTCGTGTYGFATGGIERTSTACP